MASLEEVRDSVEGACAYCSRAFGVKDQVEAANVPLLDDFSGHPTLRSLISVGVACVRAHECAAPARIV
jgi:hypothetical protein